MSWLRAQLVDVSSCRLVMSAIVGEKLEGFPKQDELKCVFVEHEIEEEEFGVQDDGFPILSVYERIRGLPVPPKGLRAARCACLFAYVDYPCLRKDCALHGALRFRSVCGVF